MKTVKKIIRFVLYVVFALWVLVVAMLSVEKNYGSILVSDIFAFVLVYGLIVFSFYFLVYGFKNTMENIVYKFYQIKEKVKNEKD